MVFETCAVSVHVPAPTKLTTPELTVHTPVVDDVTDVVPSLEVETVGVNEPPTRGDVGMLVTVGEVGTPRSRGSENSTNQPRPRSGRRLRLEPNSYGWSCW